jgi:hypothetical protein
MNDASALIMRRTAFALLVIAMSDLWTSAQDAPQDSHNLCSVQGTVTDARTAQPLNGAVVSLQALSPSIKWSSAPSVTDSDGHFKFESLLPGPYRLTASRSGYLNRDERRESPAEDVVSLSPGQHVDDAIIHLIPGAFIAGYVRLEDDEIAAGVTVVAMKYSYQGERRRLIDAGHSVTRSDGDYRIEGLARGEYFVRAIPPLGLVARARDRAYFPLFYPGVRDPSGTQALELRPGHELSGINLKFVTVHSVRVSGRVLNNRSVPAKNAQVALVAGSGSMTFGFGQASTNAKGEFGIPGVPPGSYTLVAEQFGDGEAGKVMRGRASVEVAERDVAKVEVVIGPGVSVTGHVRVESEKTPALPNLNAVLDPQDDLSSLGLAPDIARVPIGADGTFTFRYVPEAVYHLKIFPLVDGFYLKPGGEDDLIKVGRNDVAVAELTLRSGAGRITGSVSKNKHPFAGATVVLVPDAPRRGQSRFYRQASSDSRGRFAISSVNPGDYELFCWEDVERGSYFDPDFLRPYEDSGQALKVEEGTDVDVELELTPASDWLP